MINKKSLYLLSLFSIAFAGTITQATPQEKNSPNLSMLKRAMQDRRIVALASATAGVVLGVAGTLIVVYREGVFNGLAHVANKLWSRGKHDGSEAIEDISQ